VYLFVRVFHCLFAFYKALRVALEGLRADQLACLTNYSSSLREAQTAAAAACGQFDGKLEEAQIKYKTELSARRKYFNLVQELRGNIRVYCRVRPIIAKDVEKSAVSCCAYPDADADPEEGARLLSLEVAAKANASVNNSSTKPQKYEFDRVFGPESSQQEVFDATKWLVNSCMDGYNVCIFAFGQTGSGKTFTMEGASEQGAGQERGLNYRALDELFRIKKEREPDSEYTLQVSMLEIYNERIRDLLLESVKEEKVERDDDFKEEKDKEPKIRSGPNGMFVEGLTLRDVSTPEGVAAAMVYGKANRSTGVTNMNEHSSRSHMILSITVKGFNKVAGVTYLGKLHLIDLAGSERLSKSQATGDRLKEAQNINRSLAALGNVMEALAKKRDHIPYRDSKLTFLLQDSLGGQAKTLMFAQISPTNDDYEESLCSLNFATRVRKVELGKSQRNIKTLKEVKEETVTPTKDSDEATVTSSRHVSPIKSRPGTAAARVGRNNVGTGGGSAVRPRSSTVVTPNPAARSKSATPTKQ
jgi:kinesin family protein C2/C3